MSTEVFVAPVVFATNAISKAFGASGVEGSIRLDGLQMQMLANLSSKLGVLHEQIGVLLDQNKKIAERLATLPSATVEELYKNNLQGIFWLAREKLGAHGQYPMSTESRAASCSTVFSDVLRELQIGRSKLFATSNFLQAPLAATCLQYELLLMYVTGEPDSFVRQALKSYSQWFSNCRNVGSPSDPGLAERHLLSFKAMETVEAQMPNGGGYLWQTTVVDREILEFQPYIYRIKYSTSFNKRQLIRNLLIDEEVKQAAEPLINKGLIRREWLPCTVTGVTDSTTYTREFWTDWIGETMKPPGEVDLNFSPDFSIPNTGTRALVETSTYDSFESLLSSPQIRTGFSSKAQDLLVYAALLDCVDQVLGAIAKLMATDPVEFRGRLLDVSKQIDNIVVHAAANAAKWAAALSKSRELASDSAEKAKIDELAERMRALSIRSDNILIEYQVAEQEILSNLSRDLLDVISGVFEPIGLELERGIASLGREAEIFARNVVKNTDKALGDVGSELRRAIENTETLIVAVGGTFESTLKLSFASVEAAGQRLAEGKFVDAIWHLATDPIKNQEKTSFEALQKSDLLRSIATSAATIYGGPSGAAAFAAWYSYRSTGDLGLAMKLGAISYFTSWATANVNALPEGPVPDNWSVPIDLNETVKRSVLTATIGAAAIAATGGSEEEVLAGFLKGAALTMASTYYHSVTNRNIDGKGATRPKIDKGASKYKHLRFFNKKGQEVLDIRKLSPEATHVGIAGSANPLVQEGGFLMTRVSEVPYMNAMAYLHDQVCAVEGFDQSMIILTIPPAIVITAAGTPAPLLDMIIEAVQEP